MPDNHVVGYLYMHISDQNSDAMFKGLLDSAYDGIYVTDAKGKTIFLNVLMSEFQVSAETFF